MPEPVIPDLAGDLQRIHRVVTRSLGVGLETSEKYAPGFPDDSTREGFYNYIHSLSSLLFSHHLGEDEIAFPQIRVRMPDAPVDHLCADHLEMQEMLNEIDALLEEVGAGSSDQEVLAGLKNVLERLNTLWNSHIHLEEDVFSAKKVHAAFQSYEETDLSQTMSQHGQKNSGPDYLLLPYILYNLTGQDREQMARSMPAVITQELIPVVWKDKWASMKPFLLS